MILSVGIWESGSSIDYFHTSGEEFILIQRLKWYHQNNYWKWKFKGYPYRSSMSQTMRTSFKNLSVEIKKKFKPNKLLEIGSNDGALIKNFDKKKVIGIEPCKNLAKITKKMNYHTFDNYWDFKLAKKIKK